MSFHIQKKPAFFFQASSSLFKEIDTARGKVPSPWASGVQSLEKGVSGYGAEWYMQG